jgi:hypothetical protein
MIAVQRCRPASWMCMFLKASGGNSRSEQAPNRRTKLFGQAAADMALVPPALVKPTIAALAVIRTVVEGPQHMLLKDAIAPSSANPIAATARAYQFRGLLILHVAVSQGHSNWRSS